MKADYQVMTILALAIVLALVLRSCEGPGNVTYKAQLDSVIAAHDIAVDTMMANLINADWALRDAQRRQERDSLQAALATAQLQPVKAQVKRLLQLNETLQLQADTPAIVRNCDSLALQTSNLVVLQDTLEDRRHRFDSSLQATGFFYEKKIEALSLRLAAEQRQRQLLQSIAVQVTASHDSRWSIGAGAGISATANGVRPAAQLGIYYNFLTFKKRR